MPATKNKKVSPPKRGKRPSPAKSTKQNEEKAKYETQDAVIKELCKDVKVDIPSGMIENETEDMLRNVESRLSYQGLKLDQYLKMMGKTAEEVKKEYEPQAIEGIKSRLALEAVIKAEKIEATGWLESAYVEWSTDYKADSYNAYVKEKDGEYVKLDDELIRHYKTDKDYYRADALGLKEGTYIMKIVPVKDGKEVASKALETEEIAVASHDRSGFAFSSDSKYKTGSGAYNDDGTLKQDAVVLYVTKDTAKTVTMTVKTDTNKTTKCVGIQTIIDALQKGKETRPVDIRIIGTVTKNDLDKISSSSEGLQVKGKNAYSDMKLTIEGVGSDACIKDFGILVRNAANV